MFDNNTCSRYVRLHLFKHGFFYHFGPIIIQHFLETEGRRWCIIIYHGASVRRYKCGETRADKRPGRWAIYKLLYLRGGSYNQFEAYQIMNFRISGVVLKRRGGVSNLGNNLVVVRLQ